MNVGGNSFHLCHRCIGKGFAPRRAHQLHHPKHSHWSSAGHLCFCFPPTSWILSLIYLSLILLAEYLWLQSHIKQLILLLSPKCCPDSQRCHHLSWHQSHLPPIMMFRTFFMQSMLPPKNSMATVPTTMIWNSFLVQCQGPLSHLSVPAPPYTLVLLLEVLLLEILAWICQI